MGTYISPTGNPEVWEAKPTDYFTQDEWERAHPAPIPTLNEIKQDKLAEIATAYETVLSYVISPDSSSAVDTALAIQDFNADDPEGLAFIRQQLKARRTALEATVAASFDDAAVQAIVVSFNV